VREGDHLEDLGVDGRTILRFQETRFGGGGAGLVWIATDGGHL